MHYEPRRKLLMKILKGEGIIRFCISVKCVDHKVAKVLMDNGSSLNVMPKMTLDKFSFDASYIRPSSMVVRAFDGSRRDVKGEIDLLIQIC